MPRVWDLISEFLTKSFLKAIEKEREILKMSDIKYRKIFVENIKYEGHCNEKYVISLCSQGHSFMT